MGTVIRVVAATRKNFQLDQLLENFDSKSISKPEDNLIKNSSVSNSPNSRNIELGTSVLGSQELEPRRQIKKLLAAPNIYSKRLIKIGKLYKNIQHSIKEKQVCVLCAILTLF